METKVIKGIQLGDANVVYVLENTNSTTSGGVGERTPEGGEIFNDYMDNIATGHYSHAEGLCSSANGTAAHAEGNSNAIGDYSHTEGVGTIAIGEESHSEGWSSIAGGRGFKIIAASGENGLGTYELSSVEGLENDMQYSVRLSYARYIKGKITNIDTINNIITVDNYEYLKPDKETNDPRDPVNYLTIYGRPDLGDYDIGIFAHAEGEKTVATERASHAEGRETMVIGQYGHAEGRGTIAGYSGHAEGRETKALGDMSHAEGNYSGSVSKNDIVYTTALGTASHAEGRGTLAAGNNSHSEGELTKSYSRANHAEGYQTTAGVEGSTNSIAGAHAEGRNTHATASGAHAEGNGTKATASDAHAEGYNTIAASANQHVEGAYNIADENGVYAHILGGGCEYATGHANTVFDLRDKHCTIFYSIVGKTSSNTTNGVNFIVYGAQHSLNNFVELAQSGFIYDKTQSVEMRINITDMDFLKLEIVAEKDHSSCGGAWADALIGRHYAYYRSDDVVCEPVRDITDNPKDWIFNIIYLSDLDYIISDYPPSSTDPIRHACPDCQWYTIKNPVPITLQDSANRSHTFEKGLGVHPYAINTTPVVKTVQQNAHTIDWGGNATFAGTIMAAGEKVLTQQSNGGTVANHRTNTADYYAHAEGYLTRATGAGSHAEGFGDDQDGLLYNNASGQGSHAEGVIASAAGTAAHAEGIHSLAYGYGSHAEGVGSSAISKAQHVQGAYNIPDIYDANGLMHDKDGNTTEDMSSAVPAERYLDIVGNGHLFMGRSNAHTLDWFGNSWYQGILKSGGMSYDDPAAKTVLTERDIPQTDIQRKYLLKNYKFIKDINTRPFAPITSPLQIGHTYYIVWDDSIVYKCTPNYYIYPEVNLLKKTILCIGNFHYLDNNIYEDTGEPFFFYAIDDQTLLIATGDSDNEHILSIYEYAPTIDAQYINNMYYSEPGNLIYASPITEYEELFTESSEILYQADLLNLNFKFVKNQPYHIQWNGRSYLCVAQYGESEDVCGFGNLLLLATGSDSIHDYEIVNAFDTGAPFCCISSRDESFIIWTGQASASIAIYEAEGEIHTIPEKYLPELIGHTTEHGGEIFNDYENNAAYGDQSHAEGRRTIAGTKGFTITGVSEVWEDYPTYPQYGMYTLDNIEGLAEGMQVMAYLDGQGLAPSTIIGFSGTSILVAPYEYRNLITDNPGYGIVNKLIVLNHPELGTSLIGHSAHAEGNLTQSASAATHAEGSKTSAIGPSSHVEGGHTIAYGAYSHAEGIYSGSIHDGPNGPNDPTGSSAVYTTAYGIGSHAEGRGTQAGSIRDNVFVGDAAHAEGINTIAAEKATHAEGRGTVATRENQHIQGKYNYLDENGDAGDYLHIVGNGASDSSRSNAHTLDQQGNAWFAGMVEATAIVLKTPNGSRYQISIDDNGDWVKTKL